MYPHVTQFETRQQQLRDELRLLRRQVEYVDGVFEARLRVDVRPEPRARRLEIRDQLTALEVLAPVERHVLEHVRQAALVLGLVYRAGAHREPQQDAIGRTRVPADEVLQPVRQRPGADAGVHGQRRFEVLRRSERHERQRDQKKAAGEARGGSRWLSPGRRPDDARR